MFRRQDGLAGAQKQFDKGDVEGAAWALHNEHWQARANNDSARLDEIDQVVSVMRKRLEHDERLAAFDAHIAGRESIGATETEIAAYPTPAEGTVAFPPVSLGMVDAGADADITPLSLGIVLAGAGVMLIAVFLPQFESNTFAQIEKNSLIQNGDGWWFIVLAVLAAGAAYRSYRNQRRSFGAVVIGAIGILLAIYYGTSHSQRSLCSVSPVTFGQHCSLATPGIGIYATGVGGLLIVIGGWQIFRSDLVEFGEEEDEEEEEEEATPQAEASPASTIAERLRTLDQLRSNDVITDAEYARRRTALIDEV